jgi:transposase-like protein
VIMVLDTDVAEADLVAGAIGCPRCGGRLRPWSRASIRRVRLVDGATRRLQPRRGRCASCRATQVLLPAWCLPRRADAVEVVAAALIAKAGGDGFRRIAARLDRSPWTVRAWLRRARGGHLRWLRERAVEHAANLDREVLAAEAVPRDAIGSALSGLAAAVAAYWRRCDRHADVWALVGVFTGGRLLAAP